MTTTLQAPTAQRAPMTALRKTAFVAGALLPADLRHLDPDPRASTAR